MSLLTTTLTNAAQRLDHPPARVPKATPNATSPANELDMTPHRRNVASDVKTSDVSAIGQGLNRSDSIPRED